jgi:preprotein translocase subunit SecA
VGTCSVAASERLAAMLEEAGLPHQLLNARQDRHEAEIVARAGEPGRITVATSMAGRGTDIALGEGVAERGGLHVIATERAEAARIDRQLRGRCGRQGDPGSCEAILSLDDALPSQFYRPVVRQLLCRLRAPGGALPRILGEMLMYFPQRAVEARHVRMRRELRQLDERLGEALAFAGPTE